MTAVGEQAPEVVYRRSVPLDSLDGARASHRGPRVQPPDGYRSNFDDRFEATYMHMPRGGGSASNASFCAHMQEAASQRLAQALTSGCEMAIAWGCSKVVDAYKWMCPLRPEDILLRGLFKRRDIDRMLEECIKDNRTFLMLQPHRVSNAMRQHIVGSGFRVEDTSFDGEPSVKVHLLPQQALPAAK